ncbi:uncharacterized protein K452DRAFT_48005 [Aplosporella prunicola CBS 121167]|uniref:Uncharacterized protein n=1 Tax=Aplosporella prunicola CBS 121167 TaxID=1176127 RepID=A0A6A6B973_9PEZI|nr:uncharacterized protein K452DRAFT_48005 [Aplosporella prunicola CBS 121167]KAF2140546.1 hypothetical protein K452DRAFT_48005 [Aplosporella prunicola CBS 121167]
MVCAYAVWWSLRAAPSPLTPGHVPLAELSCPAAVPSTLSCRVAVLPRSCCACDWGLSTFDSCYETDRHDRQTRCTYLLKQGDARALKHALSA